MTNYLPTPLKEVITVRSLITLHYFNFKGRLVPGESHDFPEIFYVAQGRVRTFVDGEEKHLETGQMILYAPNSFHGRRHPQEPGNASVAGIVTFECDSPAIQALYNRVITLNARQKDLLSRLLNEGIPLFDFRRRASGLLGLIPKGEVTDLDLQNLKELLQLFLLDVLKEDAQSSAPLPSAKRLNNPEMEQVTQYLLINLDRSLTSAEMAGALNMSVSYLRRLVAKAKNCGPVTYFIGLKIEKAKFYLETSSMTVTEISQKLGFSSVHYFSKQFKEKTGLTPSAYKPRPQ